MIPNQWYVVLDASQARGAPVGITRMGEKPVQGDRPIVEYRRRRQQLLDRARQAAAGGERS